MSVSKIQAPILETPVDGCRKRDCALAGLYKPYDNCPAVAVYGEENMAKKRRSSKKKSNKKSTQSSRSAPAKYPRHAIDKALRIPKAILDQNAGKPCTRKEAAGYVGVGFSGPFTVEVSSSSKYGFLDPQEDGKIKVSALAMRILRPKDEKSALQGYREAIFKAPGISDVYKHYRGENIPDDQFFKNTIVDTCRIPEDKFEEFKKVFI